MATRTVSRAEWRDARLALLQKEKALTRARDELAAARRALPRVRVDAAYGFDGENGPETLADLFGSRSQLAVYHFMFGPGWDAGCPMCSFWADNLAGLAPHLAARDVALVLVSAAPFYALDAYRRRMGWELKWVSSGGTAFNHDFGVSFTPEELETGDFEYNWKRSGFSGPEAPGFSAFQKDPDGTVYHTYSAYARGLEPLNAAYGLLDLMPKGRDEGDLPFSMAWVRRRDEYGAPVRKAPT